MLPSVYTHAVPILSIPRPRGEEGWTEPDGIRFDEETFNISDWDALLKSCHVSGANSTGFCFWPSKQSKRRQLSLLSCVLLASALARMWRANRVWYVSMLLSQNHESLLSYYSAVNEKVECILEFATSMLQK
jgi:hypothetical protein